MARHVARVERLAVLPMPAVAVRIVGMTLRHTSTATIGAVGMAPQPTSPHGHCWGGMCGAVACGHNHCYDTQDGTGPHSYGDRWGDRDVTITRAHSIWLVGMELQSALAAVVQVTGIAPPRATAAVVGSGGECC